MTYMLVRHRVADFDVWRAVFDSHAEAQREAGLRARHVFRNRAEPNELYLFLEDVLKVDARGDE